MRLQDPLDDVFANRSHVRVLRALDRLPEGIGVSARDVARRSGVSHPTASRVLASLVDQGVVAARRSLAADAFTLNRHHLLVERLRVLFAWERRLLDELIRLLARELKREAPWIVAAYVFGSATRGDMTSSSDVDLAVVVPDENMAHQTEAALEHIAKAVRRRFGNRLDLTIGTAPITELQRPGHRGNRLWAVIVREGIAILERAEADQDMRAAHA